MSYTDVENVIDGAVIAPSDLPALEIQEELDRILNSRVFINSHRIRRFLQFVVEESLRGQQHRLKEYPIGLNVFDRRDAFDPRIDSIVRVEARRLRAKLDGYYLTEGRDARIRILLRKGCYVPVFEHSERAENGSGSTDSRSPRRFIAIAPFIVSNASGDSSSLLEEVRRRLAHVLIKEGHFQVIAQPQRAAAAGEAVSISEHSSPTPAPDFVIEGSAEINAEQRLRLIVQLLNVSSGSYVWSESTDCYAHDLSGIEDLARVLNREMRGPRM